jgi:hypothetical protein
VIVFLWDVSAPGGSARGVTDDAGRARLAAAACMGQAGAAGRVERAVPLVGGARLSDGYRHLGSGWTARQRDGRTTWAAFREPAAELGRAS